MVQPIETKLNAIGFTITLQGGRPENQDAVRSWSTPLGTVIAVCDGMGGMQGGRIASEIAVNTILETIIQAEGQSNPQMTLIKAIRNANMAILREGQMHAHLKGMGTTAAVLLLSEKSALVAYVGDTRIYQLRNNKKVFRTFDHSMVFEMVRKKVITEEQARLSAQSNIILRALGVKPDLEVETTELPYRKGDKFLLCSDGFWGCLPENEFLHLLDGQQRMDRKLEEAAYKIDQIGRQKGGEHDNLTAALITMNANSILKEKMNRTSKIIITALATLLVASVGLNVHLMAGHSLPEAEKEAQDTTLMQNQEMPAETSPTSAQDAEKHTPDQPNRPTGTDTVDPAKGNAGSNAEEDRDNNGNATSFSEKLAPAAQQKEEPAVRASSKPEATGKKGKEAAQAETVPARDLRSTTLGEADEEITHPKTETKKQGA